MNGKNAQGVINYSEDTHRNDYLFRVSLKAVIFNEEGHILVVKESGREWWDIPGGGMDHAEFIKDALRRELYEEVSLQGEFTFTALLVEDPRFLDHSRLYQIRVTFVVKPENLTFEAGDDGDEVAFMDPVVFKDSQLFEEQKIYEYCQLAMNRKS